MKSQQRWSATRRTVRTTIAGMFIVMLIILVSIPSNRRWVADPTGQPAQLGITEIVVRGDWFQNHVYAPSVVRVPVGTTITWQFVDRGASGTDEPAAHNVVGQDWASPVLTTGAYQHTFTAPGTYRYTCTLHTNMDGMVEVVAR